MTNFIEKILDVLPEYQKASLKSLLDKKTKVENITSLRLKSEEAQRLYSSLKGKLGNILLSPIYQTNGEKISSESINSNSEEIYTDLNALYLYIDKLSKINDINTVSLDSEYLKSRAAIEKLLNDVKTFSLRKRYNQYNEVKVVDFNINRNHTKATPAANINKKTRLLELPVIYSSRYHLQNRLDKFTTVYTKTYTRGSYGNISKSFDPYKSIDQKLETFWGHIVMSDGPIVQKYERKSFGDSYLEEVNGPVVEIYYNFSNIAKLNVVRLFPFSEFPVTVYDISYRTSDASSFFQTIPLFNKESTLDWVEYNFEPIYAKELRITLLQENYKKVNYTFPKQFILNSDLFNRVLEQKAASLDSSIVFDSDEYVELLNLTNPYKEAIESLNSLVANLDSISATSVDFLESYQTNIDSILDGIKDTKTDLVTVSKYEYILGLKEVELCYELFSPIARYDSEKYNLKATPSEVSIEADYETSNNTSVEFEIDFGEGRRLPIHPKNITGDGGIYRVYEERIEFDKSTLAGYTRLGSYLGLLINLKKDGDIVSPENYEVSRITGAIPKLYVELSGSVWDRSSIYTVDYAVSPVSVNLPVLDSFISRDVSTPEVFNSIGENNDVQLSKFPFINYEIINSSWTFSKNTGESNYIFTPLQENISSGQVRITPTIVDLAGNILQTGNITGYGISGLWGTNSGQSPVNFGNVLSSSYFNSISGLSFGYYLGVMNNDEYFKIASFQTGITGFVLDTPYEITIDQATSWASEATGISFVGDLNTPSGYLQINYTIGVGVETDDRIYTLGNVKYDPLTVKVGGRLAKNITNYESLIHPAFSIANTKDTEYEYIQAGKSLYFNQKTDKEITVDYSWMVEYISIGCNLRCNKIINPDRTPKIDEVRILINNTVI